MIISLFTCVVVVLHIDLCVFCFLFFGAVNWPCSCEFPVFLLQIRNTKQITFPSTHALHKKETETGAASVCGDVSVASDMDSLLKPASFNWL